MSSLELTAKIAIDKISTRLDVVLAELFSDYSRSRIKEWIKSGSVTLDGKVNAKPNFKVFGGEKVIIKAEIEDEVNAEPENIPIDIIYQDDDIAVINKQIGLVVHPGAGNPNGTLMNALLFHFPEVREVPRGGIVHRLDKETSGLMVIAKTIPAQTNLIEQLQVHSVGRIYDAIVVGKMKTGGTIEANIGRHPTDRVKMAVLSHGGKKAISHYRVLEHFREHSRIRVKLETGRTHQIRVHMASLGFPLVGDPTYGGRLRIPQKMMPEFVDYLRGYKQQALHAGQLSLRHPKTGKEMKWKVAMPDYMLDLVDMLRDDLEDYQAQFSRRYDEYEDEDCGVEIAWVTDADIPED